MAGRNAAAVDGQPPSVASGSVSATTDPPSPAAVTRSFRGSRAYQDRTGANFSVSAEITISGAAVDTAGSEPGQATMQLRGAASVTIINTRPDRDLKIDVTDASIVGYWKTPQQRAFCTPGTYCHLGLMRQPLTGYLAQQGYPASGPITMVPGSSVRLRFQSLPGRMESEPWIRRAAGEAAAGSGPELLVVSLPSAVTNRGATWSCTAANAALTFAPDGSMLTPEQAMARFGCTR